MFNKIRRFYNQNSKKIIMVILIIIMIIVLIQFFNYIAKQNLKEKNNKTITNSEIKTQTQSIISDTKIGENTAKENENTIKEFVNYCNNKNIESAYNMLSDECKEILYDNKINNFQENYYNLVFKSNKSYTSENWISYNGKTTYKITYQDDALTNGGTNLGENYGDYITIVEKNGEKKLNIAKFVCRDEINKIYEDDNIKIEIVYVNKYINNEIYKIKITNKTKQIINLYSRENETNWYIQDKNSTKYNAIVSTIPESLLLINQSTEEELMVQFNKNYNPNKEIQTMHWDNMLLNNEKTSVDFKF